MERKYSYDVVVVGGGAAGIGAAVGAAQTGARTLLVEKNPYFGGAATHSSVLTYCGFFTQGEPYEQIVGGVGQQVLNQLAKMGMYNGPRRTARTRTVIVPLDPEVTKVALDRCIMESKVEPLLHAQVIAAEVQQGRIRAIQCIDHAGPFVIEAGAFVDASGEANLTSLAGGGVVFGDDQGHLQSATLMIRIGGVLAEADAHPLKVEEAVQKGKAAGIVGLTKELGTVVRMPGCGDVLAILCDEEVNGLEAASLTRAEISARNQAWAYLEAFKRFLPGFENAYLVQTGPQIGIRETRHVVGEYCLKGEDVLEARRFSDAIARGGWPVELHPEPGAPNVWHQIKDQSFYDIPLRSLKVNGVDNLWAAGRTIDCDPIAFASARVMGTAFATGHAAGVAAALTSSSGQADAQAVRAELLRQEAII
ncbi:FAD-dependent oxidoreductase [Brevibacillus fulvus]|uniref:Ribulose 1,5-bisphosphate synthetase/thiazole synthase n=1 Tax=Brevibacillus fulvus TaxID=1125967 RepID=A0A939BUZ6_9BACL|nr:FAD-dependent oxidoreductase [Brevibacillus fulvus]MBM7590944.1 ribulose 1,5-bisphosphate synthetase/thiazole synthase [Brevibacillus fulvus]